MAFALTYGLPSAQRIQWLSLLERLSLGVAYFALPQVLSRWVNRYILKQVFSLRLRMEGLIEEMKREDTGLMEVPQDLIKVVASFEGFEASFGLLPRAVVKSEAKEAYAEVKNALGAAKRLRDYCEQVVASNQLDTTEYLSKDPVLMARIQADKGGKFFSAEDWEAYTRP